MKVEVKTSKQTYKNQIKKNATLAKKRWTRKGPKLMLPINLNHFPD